MYCYMQAQVKKKQGQKLIFENNKIGYYSNYVGDISEVIVGCEYKIYIEEIFNNKFEWWSFLDSKNRDVFILLIGVRGVGPLSARNIINLYCFEEIKHIVKTGDVERLKKVPKIGTKVGLNIIKALQIVFDDNDDDLVMVIKYMEDLGFKRSLIKAYYSQLSPGLTVDEKIMSILKMT